MQSPFYWEKQALKVHFYLPILGQQLRWLASTWKYFWKLSQGLWAAIFRTHLDSFFKFKIQRINLPFN